MSRPNKGTAEWDLWIAAIEVATDPPLTHAATTTYDAKVSWRRIEALRDALDALGVDWRKAKEAGHASLAMVTASACVIVVGLAPWFNPGGGWVRLALAVGAVGAILAAHAWPWCSRDDAWARHIRRCARCQTFQGGCSEWRRISRHYENVR